MDAFEKHEMRHSAIRAKWGDNQEAWTMSNIKIIYKDLSLMDI